MFSSKPLRQNLALTPLEQIAPRMYTHFILPFALKRDIKSERIFHILEAGLEATRRRYPIFGHAIAPDIDSRQANAVKLQAIDGQQRIPLQINDMSHRDSFPRTFEWLQKRRFPLSAFPYSTLCCAPTWPIAKEAMPVALAQANFIPGGLLLNIGLFHTVVDSTTARFFIQTWAEECRRVDEKIVSPENDIKDLRVLDREKVHLHGKYQDKFRGKLEDHPEYITIADPTTQLRGLADTADVTAQVFYLSPTSLKQLKKNVMDDLFLTSETYISTNDALAALIWHAVLNARLRFLDSKPKSLSVFGFPLDGRKMLAPCIDEETLGCFAVMGKVELPIDIVQSRTGLAYMAQSIRRETDRIRKQCAGTNTNDVMALLENQSDVSQVVSPAFLDVSGLNCVLSSWARDGWYGHDWGKSLGGYEAVRVTSYGQCPNVHSILPEVPGGGREIIISASSDIVDAIMQNSVLLTYCRPIAE